MKKYKYMTIRVRAAEPVFEGKPEYEVINSKTKAILGLIYWYKPWKEYVFTQYQQSNIFNNSCLHDLLDFMENEIPLYDV